MALFAKFHEQVFLLPRGTTPTAPHAHGFMLRLACAENQQAKFRVRPPVFQASPQPFSVSMPLTGQYWLQRARRLQHLRSEYKTVGVYEEKLCNV